MMNPDAMNGFILAVVNRYYVERQRQLSPYPTFEGDTDLDFTIIQSSFRADGVEHILFIVKEKDNTFYVVGFEGKHQHGNL